MNPILERARAASKALAEHRERQRVLHDVIRLGEASVAALQAELAKERAAQIEQAAQRLDDLISRSKRRAEMLDRIAPNCSTVSTKGKK